MAGNCEIAALIVCQLIFWTLVPLCISRSMPLDVVSDMLPWGHEWQLGYYKHPPLPAWLAEFVFDRFSDAGIYVLSQVAIALTFLFVFMLGREMMPRRMATAGTILLVGVFYFSIPSPEFNNNVVQMPIWAAAAYCFYKALHSREWRDWFWLGVAAGLGMLAKYSTAMLLLTMALYTAVHPDHRRLWRSRELYVCGAVAFAVFLPHLVWLIHNHFVTLAYAQTRAGAPSGSLMRLAVPAQFIATQIADHLPALLLATAGGFVSRDLGRGLTPSQRNDFGFLLAIGLGPASITVVLAAVTGLGLRDMWGAPMWNLSGLTLVLAAASYWRRLSLRNFYAAAAAVFCACLLAYVLTQRAEWIGNNAPSRLAWPDRAMALRFSKDFRRVTGEPLRIVGGDDWLAGLIAMRASRRPSVISGEGLGTAPWITPAKLQREGALIVWAHGGGRHALAMAAHIHGFHPIGAEQFQRPAGAHASPLMVDWGIVAPSAPRTCR